MNTVIKVEAEYHEVDAPDQIFQMNAGGRIMRKKADGGWKAHRKMSVSCFIGRVRRGLLRLASPPPDAPATVGLTKAEAEIAHNGISAIEGALSEAEIALQAKLVAFLARRSR